MKNFLKVLLLTTGIALASTASAQLLPISLGVKGGTNVSNLSTDDAKSKNGFNAGLTLDVNLPAGFGIFSGLEVNTKGAKSENEISDLKYNPIYLQLPVRLGYRLKLLPGLRAHFGFGPYFAQGIGGKVKGTEGGEKVDAKIFDDNGWKKMDWGLGAEVGVTVIGRIQVRTGYDFGLKNVARGDEKVKNRNFYVSAGLIIL